MTNLKVKIKLPGYPVYRAYLVPYSERADSVREVKQEDIEKWGELLSKLREFVHESLRFSGAESMGETEKLELICDMISLFFKAPLTREPLPSVAPSPTKLYMFLRLIGVEKVLKEWPELAKDPLKLVEEIYADVIKRGFLESKVSRMISQPEVYELIERCWFTLPADTRPCYNVSSLVSHLLLSSAIAWSLAVTKGLGRDKAALLRLAAILHDIGKPFRYTEHVSASLEVAEWLLEGLSINVKGVKEFISKHHAEAKSVEAEILKKADKIAASTDRLKLIAEKVGIDEKLKKMLDRLGLEYKPDRWEMWRTLYNKREELARAGLIEDEPIKLLSRSFVEEVRRRTHNFQVLIRIKEGNEEVKELKLLLVDVGGIQDFILKREELRCVAAASIFIDSLVMAVIPMLVQYWVFRNNNVWIPYEAFLYAAGGVVQVLTPKNLEASIMRSVNELKSSTLDLGLPIFAASATFREDYSKTVRELGRNIHLSKLVISNTRRPVVEVAGEGAPDLCRICYSNPPETTVSTPEGDKPACKTCKRLYEIGRRIHFKERYFSNIHVTPDKQFTPRDVYGMEWESKNGISASKYVVEIISGHNREELEAIEGLTRPRVEIRDIATVKVDGNLIGAFITTCVSPSDAFERSVRIDLALKKALENAIHTVYLGVESVAGEREAARTALAVRLGLIYAGGDDALILMPSWVAPTVSSIIAKTFTRELGSLRSLSIGVASANARASIWSLLSAANELMKEAKNVGREDLGVASIGFDAIEASLFSGSTLKERLKSMKHLSLSRQPLRVFGSSNYTYDMLLGVLLDSEDPIEQVKRSYLISRFIDFIETEGVRERVEEEKRKVKSVRSNVIDVVSTVKSVLKGDKTLKSYMSPLVHLYAKRQVSRLEEPEHKETIEAYKTVMKLTPLKPEESSLLADACILIKMLGGGAL